MVGFGQEEFYSALKLIIKFKNFFQMEFKEIQSLVLRTPLAFLHHPRKDNMEASPQLFFFSFPFLFFFIVLGDL